MLRRFRSFQKGNMHQMGLCKSNNCKVLSFQSWKFENFFAARQELNHMREAWVWFLDDKIIFKVCRRTNLQPFDLKLETHNTSMEIYKPPEHTQYQFKGIDAFFRQVLLFQSDPIYKGLMYCISFQLHTNVIAGFRNLMIKF